MDDQTKVNIKQLSAWSSTLKLVPPKTQSDAEDHRWIKLMAGDNARRLAGADAMPIHNFVQGLQAISANMNVEAQKKALAASRKAVSSVFTDVGDDEESSIAAEVAQAQGDVRRIEYSAEMTEIGFPARSRDQRDSPKEQPHRNDKLRLARGQSDFRSPPPKHSQSQSRNKHGDQ